MAGPAASQDQDLAYERAVIEGRKDPAFRGAIERAFLEEDAVRALTRFEASEDASRVLRLLADEGVPPGSRILDLGGGRGLLAAALSRSGYETTLCEPNPSPVCGSAAAAELREAAGASFEIEPRSVGDLPDAAFDAVVCRAVLHHIEPLVPVLEEVLRVLRPGGALVASDEPTVRNERQLARLKRENEFIKYGVDENALRKSEYLEALRAAGFARPRVLFPVSWGDYRRHVRPGSSPVLALPLYVRYRLRSTIRPAPGEVRSVVARKGP